MTRVRSEGPQGVEGFQPDAGYTLLGRATKAGLRVTARQSIILGLQSIKDAPDEDDV